MTGGSVCVSSVLVSKHLAHGKRQIIKKGENTVRVSCTNLLALLITVNSCSGSKREPGNGNQERIQSK